MKDDKIEEKMMQNDVKVFSVNGQPLAHPDLLTIRHMREIIMLKTAEMSVRLTQL